MPKLVSKSGKRGRKAQLKISPKVEVKPLFIHQAVTNEKWSIDFETHHKSKFNDPHGDEILLMGLVTYNGFETKREVFNLLAGEVIPERVLKGLADPSIVKLAHGAKFEQKQARKLGTTINNVVDTLAQERLLVSGKGLSAGLGATVYRYLGLSLDKSVRDGDLQKRRVTGRELEYVLGDCDHLFKVDALQSQALKKNGQTIAQDTENYMSIIVGDMEYYGLNFDFDYYKSLLPLLDKRVNELQVKIWSEMGCIFRKKPMGGYTGGINLNSNQQVLEILHGLGIDLPNLQSATLKSWVIQSPELTILSNLLLYKKYYKALTWDYEKFINPITGAVHCDINAQGADTFRFTASNPNLLQVTKPFITTGGDEIDFRRCFIAPEGKVLIGGDYSQNELRAFANESDHQFLLDTFNKGELDMHCHAASSVLGREVTRDSSDRNLGKAINFGLLTYKGGYVALMNSALMYEILLTEAQSRDYVIKVNKDNVEGNKWGAKVTKEAEINGYVQTRMGHRRYFLDQIKETQIRNTEIQMFCGGIIKAAMVDMHKDIQKKGLDAHIALQIHDENLLQSTDSQAEEVKELTEYHMVNQASIWLSKVSSEVDPYISPHWKK